MLGNLLGENRVPLAKQTLSILSKFIIPCYIALALTIVLLREQVAAVYSDVPEVKNMLMDVIPYFAVTICLYCVYRHFMAALIVCAMMVVILIQILVGSFAIGIPLGALFAFNYGMGLIGL